MEKHLSIENEKGVTVSLSICKISLSRLCFEFDFPRSKDFDRKCMRHHGKSSSGNWISCQETKIKRKKKKHEHKGLAQGSRRRKNSPELNTRPEGRLIRSGRDLLVKSDARKANEDLVKS